MKSRLPLIIVTSIVALGLIVGVLTMGTSSSTKTSTTPKGSTAKMNSVHVSGDLGSAPQFDSPKGTPPTEMVVEDLVVGNGAQVLPTSTLTVQYTLKAWSTGDVVDSSWSRGTPAQFPLSGVIQGWQQGLPGMKVGGRRLLVVPPTLGYGAQQVGPMKPNETLIFVIDLLGVA